VKNFKFQPGRQQRKFVELPAGLPAAGGPGADVLLFVDPALDSLLHLRERKRWRAKDGLSGAAAPAAVGDRGRERAAGRQPPLRIPVPPGTVVRRRRGGALLGDLIAPGQQLVVAAGGRGGLGARAGGGSVSPAAAALARAGRSAGVETSVLGLGPGGGAEAEGGEEGEEVGLELLLRVVADAGIVGLPNAGKSSLLARLTAAQPAVAPYPFTTLTPNLGVLCAGRAPQPLPAQQRALAVPEAERSLEDWLALAGAEGLRGEAAPPPVLADLPGLIRGAHRGVGLGRAFLRHLRRVRVLLHVLDVSVEGGPAAAAADYAAVRSELWLYNPEYTQRPHLLLLNKCDALEGGAEGAAMRGVREALRAEVEAGRERLGAPTDVLAVSAATGEGVEALLARIQSFVEEARGVEEREETAGARPARRAPELA